MSHIYIYFPMFLFVGFRYFSTWHVAFSLRHENAQNVSWLSWISHLAGVSPLVTIHSREICTMAWIGDLASCKEILEMFQTANPWQLRTSRRRFFDIFLTIGIVTRVVATTSVKHAEKPLEQHISMSGTIWNILNIGFQRWNLIKLMFHRRKMSKFAKWQHDIFGCCFRWHLRCRCLVFFFVCCSNIYEYITWNYNCETTTYIYIYILIWWIFSRCR